MKKIQLYTIASLCGLLGVGTQVNAQQIDATQVTTTVMPFLRVSPDARAGGMGDAGVATGATANAVFNNLSQLAFATPKAAVAASYNPWLKDVGSNMFLASLAGYYRLDDLQAVSASMRYFNAGDAPITDYNGNLLQTARARDIAFDLGYTRKLSSKLGLGIAVRYLNSTLAKGNFNGTQYKAAHGVAADLSVSYNGLNKDGQGWSAGLIASNLGTKMSYTGNSDERYFIPATLTGGVAYTKVFDEDNKMLLGLDVAKLMVPAVSTDDNKEPSYNDGVIQSWGNSFDNFQLAFGAGAEYVFHDRLSIRAGYHVTDKYQGNQQYLTAGIGFSYSDFECNFSYLAVTNGTTNNKNPLSNTLRFGITYDLSKLLK